MDLNQIATFVGVAQSQSFSRAADRLRIPKSTVSRRVAALEDALGVRLFQRTTRRVRLTEAGSAYFDRVAGAIEQLESASAAAREVGAPRGLLRLSAPVDFGDAFLGELIQAFAHEYPEVIIDVDLSVRQVDLVAEGFDLALRVGDVVGETLVVHPAATIETCLFASPAYLERAPAPVAVEDLTQHECVLFRSRDGRTRWRLHNRERSVVVDVSGRVMSDDYTFVHAAVMAGSGIALMPTFLGARAVRDGDLVRVLPQWSLHGAPLNLVYPSNRHLPARVLAFRDFAVGWLSDLASS